MPSSLADQVTTSLLLDDKFITKYTEVNQTRLAESYHFFAKWLQFHRIPYLECNAAFFIWINLGAVLKDVTPDEIMARLRKNRIYIAAGEHYAAEEAGWFRLVFSHPKCVLEEGLKQMAVSIQ